MAGAVAKKTVDGVRVPSKAEMKKLVTAHSKLDEPMTAAIWIFQHGPAPWLVEVLPELPDDPSAAQPLVFGPSNDFRYSLHLVSGNERSLSAALKKDKNLARAVAAGEILHEEGGVAAKLVALAKRV